MNKKHDLLIIKDIVISIILIVLLVVFSYLLINTNNRNNQIIYSFLVTFLFLNTFKSIINFIYFIKLRKLVSNNKKLKEIEKFQKKFNKFGLGNSKIQKKVTDIYVYLFIIIFLLLIIITGINNKLYILILEVILLLWVLIKLIFRIKKKN